MCRQGDLLVGGSNPFCRWQASWALVSAFHTFYTTAFLIPPSLSVGSTRDGQDFEAFIGPQKADEFKRLFSSWISNIYRESVICTSPLPLLTSGSCQPRANGPSSVSVHRQDYLQQRPLKMVTRLRSIPRLPQSLLGWITSILLPT